MADEDIRMRKFGQLLLGGLGAVSIIAVIAGPLLANLGAVPPVAGFLLYALGSMLGLVAVVAAAIAYMRQSRGWHIALAMLGVPGALLLVYTVVDSFGIPPINDISTDLLTPPAFEYAATLPANEGRDLSFPPENREVIEAAYPGVKPLGSPLSSGEMFNRVIDHVKAEPDWEVTEVRVDGEESIVEGTATSGVFRFVDDFVIRVSSENNGGSVVDMRSKSRDGTSDLGANADRIRTFFEKLGA